jgi:DNA-binding transcriptional MerR regulator
MTQTLNLDGQPLFFPASLETDAAGVILPRPLGELGPLVEQVAPDQLSRSCGGWSMAPARGSARRAGRRSIASVCCFCGSVLIARFPTSSTAPRKHRLNAERHMLSLQKHMLRLATMPEDLMNPAKMLFVRQQIADLTGVDNSTLNYWTRENILRPAEGGGGKGQHRRFPYWEVNLAAILNEVRQFGANIAALRALADVMHNSLDWANAEGLSREDLRLVMLIQDNRQTFDRQGQLAFRAVHDPNIDWPANANGRIVFDTWCQVADFMKRSEYYRSPTGLAAHFEDRHFAAAERILPIELEAHYLNVRKLVDVPREPPASPFPVFFYRQTSGEWKLTSIVGTTAVRSYIAIDLEQLIFDIWNGQ